MIYCVCQNCTSVVLFQEGDIGHVVRCTNCGAVFPLSARQIVDPPIVEEKAGLGLVLKFRCQCGRKIAIPKSLKVSRVPCPQCKRMAAVPPWPDVAASVAPAQTEGVTAKSSQAKTRRVASITSLCWVAFLLCLIAAGGGRLASEMKLSGLADSESQVLNHSAGDEVARYAHKDAPSLSPEDYQRYKSDVIDRGKASWRRVRDISTYVMGPVAGIILFFCIAMSIRKKALMRRHSQGPENRP